MLYYISKMAIQINFDLAILRNNSKCLNLRWTSCVMHMAGVNHQIYSGLCRIDIYKGNGANYPLNAKGSIPISVLMVIAFLVTIGKNLGNSGNNMDFGAYEIFGWVHFKLKVGLIAWLIVK